MCLHTSDKEVHIFVFPGVSLRLLLLKTLLGLQLIKVLCVHLDGSLDHVRDAIVLTKCLHNHREDNGLYYVF